MFTFRADSSLWIMLLPCSWLYMWLHTHHIDPTPPESTPTRLSHWSQMEKISVRARQLLLFGVFFIFHFRGVILRTPVGGRDTWRPSTFGKKRIRESFLFFFSRGVGREEGGVVRPVLEWVCRETCPSALRRRSLRGVGVQTKET